MAKNEARILKLEGDAEGYTLLGGATLFAAIISAGVSVESMSHGGLVFALGLVVFSLVCGRRRKIALQEAEILRARDEIEEIGKGL
jgi:uncharacterized membrane protein